LNACATWSVWNVSLRNISLRPRPVRPCIFVRRFRFSGTICSQKIISLLSTIFKGDNILYKVVRYRNYRGKLFRLETPKSKACNAWDYNTRPPCTCMKWWKANSRPPWTVYQANSRGGGYSRNWLMHNYRPALTRKFAMISICTLIEYRF
jgi:hypothetical protein